MHINNYLITGVNPANLEKEVLVDKTICIEFAKHMKSASVENSANILLRKVNGEQVAVEMTYDSIEKFVELNPLEDLEKGTQYEIHVPGGPNGIMSIIDEHMSISRTYEFTTGFSEMLTKPTNVTDTVDSGFVTLNWEPPAQYSQTLSLHYEILISTSNVAPATPESYIWPVSSAPYKEFGTSLEVPKRFTEADGPYYAYIRAINGETEGPWLLHQFAVTPLTTAPTPSPSPISPSPDGDIFASDAFDVLETYPRANSTNLTPEKIILRFSGPLKEETVTDQSVYVVKRDTPPGHTLSLIDFMTDYDPSKKVEATLTPTGDVLILQAELEQDAVYTVVVRESVESAVAGSIQIPYHFSFITEYSTLYGDAELVRSDMGSFSKDLDDKTLYKYLNDTSIYAYELVSRMASFDAASYENGAAPYYVHQYVRLKTLHDLLLHTQLHKSGGGAVKNISLGDLAVAKETDAGGSSLNSLLSQVRSRLKPFMDMMQGHNNRGYAKPSMVVRGESGQAEPEFITRSEYRELGQ